MLRHNSTTLSHIFDLKSSTLPLSMVWEVVHEKIDM